MHDFYIINSKLFIVKIVRWDRHERKDSTCLHFHGFVVFMPKGNWGTCVFLFYIGKTIPQIFPSVLQKYFFFFCIKSIKCQQILKTFIMCFSSFSFLPILFSIQGNVNSWSWLWNKHYIFGWKNMDYLFRHLFSFQGTVTLLGGVKLYLKRHLIIHWELCEQCCFLSCSVYTHCWINTLQIWEQ